MLMTISNFVGSSTGRRLLGEPGRWPSITNNANGDDTSGDGDNNDGASSMDSNDGANGIGNNDDDTSMLVMYWKVRVKQPLQAKLPIVRVSFFYLLDVVPSIRSSCS